MSRVGKRPLDIPQGVKVTVADHVVKVEGPKGNIQRRMHQDIKITADGAKVSVERPSDLRLHRCLHGTTQRLINNMIIGVTKGYMKRLEIIGIGYGAKMDGADLVINIGFTHPIRVLVPKGLQVSCPATTMISVEGPDKEQVGQYAADLREIRTSEPYNLKGIKYLDEVIKRKAGKTFVSGS